MLLTLGVNLRVVMEIVGHAALEMTMNVCAHVAVGEQRSASDKLDGRHVCGRSCQLLLSPAALDVREGGTW